MSTATATVTSAEYRTDEQIQRDVLAELKWDARVQPNEIGVAAKDGVVTLTGWVDSYTKKWAAGEAAHRVRGVKAVVNDIEVRLPSSSERTDEDIARAVVRALEWDAFVPVEKIEVTVSKGWVTLRGEVEWHDDFSKEHEGWIVDLELVGAKLGDHEETDRLPLVGIGADLKAGERRVSVMLGGRRDAHLTRIIEAPRRVWLKTPEQPAHEAIEIESEAGR